MLFNWNVNLNQALVRVIHCISIKRINKRIYIRYKTLSLLGLNFQVKFVMKHSERKFIHNSLTFTCRIIRAMGIDDDDAYDADDDDKS